MKKAAIALVLLLLIPLLMSAYTVQEFEQVIITQFGEAIGDTVTEAGLHFRMPFTQKVNRFDKRILQWDGSPARVVTHDKKYIFFDTMARWRIVDPLKFLQKVQNESGALLRLSSIINGKVKDEVSSHPLIEVVRTSDRAMVMDLSERVDEGVTTGELEDLTINVGREGLAAKILAKAQVEARNMGMELVDFRVKRINYEDRVLQDVYLRMIAERDRIAARYVSLGEGDFARILGQLDKEVKTITSEAFRKAEEIRGSADAEAASIYAAAYEQDPELYTYLKTLETYREALTDGSATVLLSAESPLFKYLQGN